MRSQLEYQSVISEHFDDIGPIWTGSINKSEAEFLTRIQEKGLSLTGSFRESSGISAPVAFGVIRDPDIQAVARKVAEGYAIGIYAGAVYHILNLVRALCASPVGLPTGIGPTNFRPFDRASTYRQNSNFEVVPENINPIRNNFARTVFNYAMTFIITHELYHVGGGHTDIVADQGFQFGLVDRPLHMMSSQAGARERQSMEYFSDVMAFIPILTAAIEDSGLKSEDVRASDNSKMAACHAAIFAVATIFAIFCPSEETYDADNSSYPPCSVRLFSLLHNAQHVLGKFGLKSSNAADLLLVQPASWAFGALNAIGYPSGGIRNELFSESTKRLTQEIHQRTDSLIDNLFKKYALISIAPYEQS